jgi:Rieske Fe-S protein
MSTDSIHDENDVRSATASYQSEFPYEQGGEAQVTRREFCNFLGLTSAGFFLGSAGFAAKAALDSRERESLAPARIEGAASLGLNSALNFNYPTEKDSAILACPVYYERQHKRLECPCHEGAFDAATGNVLYGPPPRPLDVIEIEMRDGEVWATGRKALG